MKNRVRRWTWKDWRGLSLVLLLMGVMLGGLGGCAYFFGELEGIRESRYRGTRYLPDVLPGDSHYKFTMQVGIALLVAGSSVFTGATIKGRISNQPSDRTR